MDRQMFEDLEEAQKWFDKDTAESWEEATYFNGNNHISKATGSQWEHETLFRTAKGRWVVFHRSQWQGSTDTWCEVSKADAVKWLLANGHEDAAEEHGENELAAIEG